MSQKVLLVDDVNMFIELGRDYLQLSAVDVLTARDGKEALRICQTERPALVFMDLNMPVMNGTDCCRAIKQDAALKSIPVVLISSEGKEADRLLCLGAGCDGFLTKPLDRRLFLETARRLLPSIDRREARIVCRLKVNYRALGVSLSGYIGNLSQSGVYISTPSNLQQGALLELIFALPEPQGSVITTRGRVAWVNTSKLRQKSSMPEGLGVEFLALPEQATRDIGRFIESQAGVNEQVWKVF